MSKIQNQALKDSTEAGAVLRLVPDTKVYVTANSTNKTLDDAIIDGDIGSGGTPSVTNNSTDNTYDLTSASPGEIIRHSASKPTSYLLPTAVAGKYFTFFCDPQWDSDGTSIVVSASNNQIYFERPATNDRTGSISAATYSSFDTLATAIKAAMEAADSGQTYNVSFNRNTRRFTITNAGGNPFLFDFSTRTSNSARKVMGFAAEDTSAAVTQTSMPMMYGEMRIVPASGDRIVWNGQAVDNPGFLATAKRGVLITLVAVDATTWNVFKVVSTDHIKNTTIGFEKGVSLVGRDTWVSKANFTGPLAMVGAGCTLNEYGYVFKGSDNTNPTTPSTQNIQYNSTTNSWSTRAGFSIARGLTAASASFNGYAYHFGGSASASSHTNMERYNDLSNSVSSMANSANTSTDAYAASLNGYFYYFVSRQSGFPQERYNDGTNSWSSISTTGASQWYAQTFQLNGYIYLGGGSTGFSAGNERSFTYQYNDSANTFIRKGDMTYSAAYGSGGSANGVGFSVNGANGPTATKYSNLSVYNDSLNAWINGANSSYARWRPSGFVVTGYFYVTSGNAASNITNTEEYN